MRKLSYIAIMACSLLAASCDMDIVPKGQSTLQKTTDLELMLNSKTISGRPHETLGLVVNEGYGSGFTTIKKQIEAENTLTAIYLTYNENVDRGALATKDNTYGDLYSNVYHYNVVIDKIDGADGNDNRKPSIKAEARISRAWNIFLAANIYARQYDAATAAEAGGVAYPEGTDVDTKPQLKLQECYELILADCSDEIIAQLPDKGNYTKDGNLITSKVGIFSANSNGLYDMAGNVAEWTSTIYTEAGVDAMNDLNPQLDYKAAKEDPYRLKKKSVRGGSWKDPESYIRSAWRTWEYQNQPRSYIGFRCVRSLASSSSETAKMVKEAKKKNKKSKRQK